MYGLAPNFGRRPRLGWFRAFGPPQCHRNIATFQTSPPITHVCQTPVTVVWGGLFQSATGATPSQPGAIAPGPWPKKQSGLKARPDPSPCRIPGVSPLSFGPWNGPLALVKVLALDLGRCPRLVWIRAVGPQECPRNMAPLQTSSLTANVCRHGWRSSRGHLRERQRRDAIPAWGDRPRSMAQNTFRAEGPHHRHASTPGPQHRAWNDGTGRWPW